MIRLKGFITGLLLFGIVYGIDAHMKCVRNCQLRINLAYADIYFRGIEPPQDTFTISLAECMGSK